MTEDEDRFSQHLSPVWRDRSNFVIQAALPEHGRYEQLWCRQIEDTTFEICCIPFFLYDLALGDIVRASTASGQGYLLEEVIESSGRGTFRVFFPEVVLENQQEVVARLADMGALLEWSSQKLLAIDTPDTHARAVTDFLVEGSERGQFIYERGWL